MTSLHSFMCTSSLGWYILYASQSIMSSLGKGYSERVYHNAFCAHLSQANISYRTEVLCPVMYRGQCVGTGSADLVLGNMVIELKANKEPASLALPQLRKYIKSLSHLENKTYTGAVINFNQNSGVVDYLLEPSVPVPALPTRNKMK